jgi:FkbM family methyltransferase
MVKSIVKGLMRRFGYDIVQYVKMPECPIDVLTLVVEARLAAGKPIQVLEVGANDGVRADPIRDLVVKHHLPILLVEPLPDLFERLQANYADHEGARFERCAIGQSDGDANFYRIRQVEGLPEWIYGIGSFDRKHLLKFDYPGIKDLIETVSVPVLSMKSLLTKHDDFRCDLLQVDTEGLDCKIVTWAIESGLRPAIIHYERNHVCPRERLACKQLLVEAGYRFVDIDRDTLATLEERS